MLISTFKESRKLEQHPNFAAEGEHIKGGDIFAVQKHGGFRRLPQPVQRPQHRRLSATAGPDYTHDHTPRYVHIDLAQYGHSLIRFPHQIPYPDLRLRFVLPVFGYVHHQQMLSHAI